MPQCITHVFSPSTLTLSHSPYFLLAALPAAPPAAALPAAPPAAVLPGCPSCGGLGLGGCAGVGQGAGWTAGGTREVVWPVALALMAKSEVY